MRQLAVAGVLLFCAAPVTGQTLREQCVGQPNEERCQRLADAAVTLPSRMAVLAAGGNPLPGTTGTLGMRLPGSPRVSFVVRGTLGRVQLPSTTPDDPAREVKGTGGSISVDAGVGVFDGLNLAPTIGGFGSLDVLASAGLLNVPEENGLNTSGAFTWAAGARVGILRESFTAPGVSVSAMYRSIPDVRLVPDPLVDPGSGFEADNKATWSVRGTVGKRVLGLGWTGGVGYDRVSSDVAVSYGVISPGLPVTVEVSEEGVVDSRLSYFGGASYTTSVFNIVLELGWQQNGDRAAEAYRSTRRGGVFGSAAIRLTI